MSEGTRVFRIENGIVWVRTDGTDHGWHIPEDAAEYGQIFSALSTENRRLRSLHAYDAYEGVIRDLKAENARMREALEKIKATVVDREALMIARAALSPATEPET